MKKMNESRYFSAKTYLGFLVQKVTSGQAWKTAVSIFDKIRKYTFISSVFRAVAFIIALLEKSAVLLLVVTMLLLALPISALLAFFYLLVCKIMHFKTTRKIGKWLLSGDTVTFFVTKEKIFDCNEKRLFLRQAEELASAYKSPVIIVCRDRFLCSKWYSLNLLAVKANYFFALKRKTAGKKGLKATYIVL